MQGSLSHRLLCYFLWCQISLGNWGFHEQCWNLFWASAVLIALFYLTKNNLLVCEMWQGVLVETREEKTCIGLFNWKLLEQLATNFIPWIALRLKLPVRQHFSRIEADSVTLSRKSQCDGGFWYFKMYNMTSYWWYCIVRHRDTWNMGDFYVETQV